MSDTRGLNRAVAILTLLVSAIAFTSSPRQLTGKPSQPSVQSLYVDAGAGMVLDKKNHLLWQSCNFGQVRDEKRCLGSARRLKRSKAIAYCSRLKLGRTKAESKNRRWRLPSIAELQSLVQDERRRPSINLDLFPGTSPFQYWSSTTFMDGRGLWAYVYSFQYSYRFGVNKGQFHARCVSKP